MSNYPFYQGSVEAAQQIAPGQTNTANTGLWFTRFYSSFKADWTVDVNGKRGWIDDTVGLGPSGSAEQVTSLLERQRTLCLALGGQVACLQTQGNFVTGTGLSHPVENGFAFHPVLGMPYLPAAGVKGLLRGWAEVWMDHGTQDPNALVARWFGTAKGDDLSKKIEPSAYKESAGSYIFFDALPSKPVHLGCDVMTPHMGKWYEQGGNYTASQQATTAPADWHSPNPVPFMVVKTGTDFNFMVAPRTTGNPETDATTQADLPRVMAQLQLALEWLGAGAKTAAGYGRMVNLVVTQERERLQKLEQDEINRKQAEIQRVKNLAAAGIQAGEELWHDATLHWDKGSQKLHAAVSTRKTSAWTAEAAKSWINARSKSELKKLDDRKLQRTVRVRIEGNQITLLSIEDPA